MTCSSEGQSGCFLHVISRNVSCCLSFYMLYIQTCREEKKMIEDEEGLHVSLRHIGAFRTFPQRTAAMMFTTAADL